jgi:hypothetical protein
MIPVPSLPPHRGRMLHSEMPERRCARSGLLFLTFETVEGRILGGTRPHGDA